MHFAQVEPSGEAGLEACGGGTIALVKNGDHITLGAVTDADLKL